MWPLMLVSTAWASRTGMGITSSFCLQHFFPQASTSHTSIYYHFVCAVRAPRAIREVYIIIHTMSPSWSTVDRAFPTSMEQRRGARSDFVEFSPDPPASSLFRENGCVDDETLLCPPFASHNAPRVSQARTQHYCKHAGSEHLGSAPKFPFPSKLFFLVIFAPFILAVSAHDWAL